MLYRVLLVAALVATVALAAGRPRGGVPKVWKAVNAKVDKSQEVAITIALKRRNMDVVDKIFWEVSDPRDEKYGEHLNLAELRAIVSPGAAAIGNVLQWLSRAGVKGARVSGLEDSIAFEAPIATVEKLLAVRFRMFEHQTTKRRIARATGAAKLPASISAVVEVVGGYRGFPLEHKAVRKSEKKVKVENNVGQAVMNVTPTVLYNVYNVTRFPAVPAGQYNIQSFFQAQGQAVGASDLTTFCKGFFPDLLDVCKIDKYMGTNEGGDPGIESSLDSEYIFSAGHGTETWVWSYNNFDFCGDLMRWGHDVLGNASGTYPHVISMSYGSQSLPNYCLGPDVARLSKDIQLMGTVGISVMIASGDSGSGEDSREGYNYGLLASSMPAEIPYATAVGSTTFVNNEGNSGTEIATTAFGSGGGFSYDYPQPSYQAEAVAHFFNVSTKLPPPLSYVNNGRGTPDVSALGWNFWVISGGYYEPVGGTSASTPTFSGFVTLLNAVRLQNNKTLGFLNPLLYQNPQVFTDIVGGNNDVNADGYGWYCVPGWDPATGLGTPNVGKMIELVESINAAEMKRKNKKH